MLISAPWRCGRAKYDRGSHRRGSRSAVPQRRPFYGRNIVLSPGLLGLPALTVPGQRPQAVRVRPYNLLLDLPLAVGRSQLLQRALALPVGIGEPAATAGGCQPLAWQRFGAGLQRQLA